MRKLLLLVIVVVIVFAGCVQQAPKSFKEVNFCGDGICGVTEDCRTCPQDCRCKPGEYCSETGICRVNVCGDGICSPLENQTQSCCEDCGCPSDKICNKVTQTCQEKPTISDEDVIKIVENYMKENNITGKITSIIDTYYKNETLKQVSIDCKSKELPYPCSIILYINNDGRIVEEVRIV